MLLPGALDAIGAVIAEHAPDVVACDFRMWHPDREAKSRNVALSYAPHTLTSDKAAILTRFFADRHMYLWPKIFKRSIYLRQEAPVFPVGRVFEDEALLPQLLDSCAQLYYLPQAIINYRQHPLSITRVITEKWCLDFAGAMLSARPHLLRRDPAASVTLGFDIAACHFYIGIVKNSYQLPAAAGKRVRLAIRTMLLDTLFNDLETVLAAMEHGSAVSNDHQLDARTAVQIRKSVSGNLIFHLSQAINRKIKLWRRLNKRAPGATS